MGELHRSHIDKIFPVKYVAQGEEGGSPTSTLVLERNEEVFMHSATYMPTFAFHAELIHPCARCTREFDVLAQLHDCCVFEMVSFIINIVLSQWTVQSVR